MHPKAKYFAAPKQLFQEVGVKRQCRLSIIFTDKDMNEFFVWWNRDENLATDSK